MSIREQKQHVDLFRKSWLRKTLLLHAMAGAAYVPFIGDGDLAVEHYRGREVFGADIDQARIATASSRIPEGKIIVADCNHWPFPDCSTPFAVADLDAYANPYLAFDAFWEHATKTKRLVIFGTDGQQLHIARAKQTCSLPDCRYKDSPNWRAEFNFWWISRVLPWLSNRILPYRITQSRFYLRGMHMLYWGIVCEDQAKAKKNR